MAETGSWISLILDILTGAISLIFYCHFWPMGIWQIDIWATVAAPAVLSVCTKTNISKNEV
jgi:hypothetical protein